MNNLGATKKILGMDTVRVRDKRKFIVSQENYLKKVVEKFNIPNISNYLVKVTSVPFASHFKLSKITCFRN